MDDSIEKFMTEAVHTIAAERTLSEAHELMRRYKIRHLPVMAAGRLVGIVSQRDLALVETLRGVDPKQVPVEDAMSEDVYTVSAETPLAEVARHMAHEKIGSAVVMRGNRVAGIFTGTDALAALDFLLTAPQVRAALHDAMVPRMAARS